MKVSRGKYSSRVLEGPVKDTRHTRALLRSVAELGVASMAKLDTAMRAESGFGMNEVLAKAAESSESLEQTTTRLQRQHKGLKAIRGDKDRFR